VQKRKQTIFGNMPLRDLSAEFEEVSAGYRFRNIPTETWRIARFLARKPENRTSGDSGRRKPAPPRKLQKSLHRRLVKSPNLKNRVNANSA